MKFDKLKTMNWILLFVWIVVFLNVLLAVTGGGGSNMMIAAVLAFFALLVPHTQKYLEAKRRDRK